jgi:hypothetical protein
MKRPSFDAATLRLLEDLYESTWVILEAQHPFRDTTKTTTDATNFGENSSSSGKF